MLTTPKIENIIRTWAESHKNSIIISESEIDELAERIARTMNEITKEARKDGIREYSWMKDGVTYVGTTGKTLRAAFDEVSQDG